MSRAFAKPGRDRSGNFLVPIRPPQAPLAQIHSHAAPTPSEGWLTNMSGTFAHPRRDRSGNLLVPLLAPRAAPSPFESQVTNISGTFPQRPLQALFAQILVVELHHPLTARGLIYLEHFHNHAIGVAICSRKHPSSNLPVIQLPCLLETR